MNYSCSYVLVDDERLRFYNQMMISLSSLRYTGFKGNVYIVTDSKTDLVLKDKWDELNELSAEIVVVEVEDSYSTKAKSRYIKTSLRRYIQGDVLYIDTDTVFASCLPEWISDTTLAMAYDRNGLDDKESHYWHKVWFDQCGLGLREDGCKFYNSGVIWMRDEESVHKAFEQWNSLWMDLYRTHGIAQDQLSLCYLYKNNHIVIDELEDRFNVQIGVKYISLSMLRKAYILHLFNFESDTHAFQLYDHEIKKLDYREKHIQRIIHDPWNAFSDVRQIKKNSNIDNFMNTALFSFVFFLYRRHKILFSTLDFFPGIVRKRKRHMQEKNIK